MASNQDEHQGHRERLRSRFQTHPGSISDQELLELLLVYAIPRRDVAPIADQLFARFGDLVAIFSASTAEVVQVPGMGPHAAVFLKVIDEIMKRSTRHQNHQPALPTLEPEIASVKPIHERSMRVFANDEAANSLALLPKAAQFARMEDFRAFLTESLPYNSLETRRRRAQYILDRFYADRVFSSPITRFTGQATEQGVKAAIFYHILKAEPILIKVAEDLIYPNLALGRVSRNQLNEFPQQYLPEAGLRSFEKMLRSLLDTYRLLDVGVETKEYLRFNLRPGCLDGLVYILTSEFPEPGIYSFDQLYAGPAHRWLLWDREWLRKQLYRLHDMDIISKVSEIDTVRQFSLNLSQSEALELFFARVAEKPGILREAGDEPYQADETGTRG